MRPKHEYSESVERNNYTVINCKSCGYWHTYPIPSKEELNRYYENKYYENFTENENRSMTDKKSDPDGFYTIQYEDRLRHINNIISNRLPRTIIDIGAGYGDFLYFMKKNGWMVSGIEPSKEAYEFFKDEDLNIRLGSFEELLDVGFHKASVITLNNVLEHLRDPEKVLLEIKEHLLNRDGILHIAIPNDFSIFQDLQMKTALKYNTEKQYYWVTPLEHLNYWSHETIQKFLNRLGFEMKYITSTFPIDIFPLMGDDYITHPEIGRNTHLKQVHFEKVLQSTKSYDVKDALYSSFAKLGIGRLILVYAKPATEV